jgi:hypothetical protein
MPKLNDYIGSLVSSITKARVMSDIQTVKVAEEYAKHDLLKHFSIPRMRIDDIEMTIPIALDELNEKTETVYEPIDNVKFNSIVYKELVNNLGLSKLPSKSSQKLRSEIANQTQILEKNIRISKDISYLKSYTKELVQIISNLEKEKLLIVGDLKRKSIFENLPSNLEKILIQEIKISEQKKIIENLNVIVEANKLREQKPENIIYIKLKISEDGMEWNRTENKDGSIESKLLPE